MAQTKSLLCHRERQRGDLVSKRDCHVATAPRNDGEKENPLITTIEEEMEKIDQAQPTEIVPQKQPDSYRESVE